MKAVMTFEGGFKQIIELTPLKRTDTRFIEQMEEDVVKNWNISQPNMVHKAVKCHILRN